MARPIKSAVCERGSISVPFSRFTFTPTGSSWLNLVETLFSPTLTGDGDPLRQLPGRF